MPCGEMQVWEVSQTGVLEIDTQGQPFVLPAGSTYVDDSGSSTVLTQDMTFGAVGTTIRVFDADGKPLATSVDSGAASGSRPSVILPAAAGARRFFFVFQSAAVWRK